MSILLAQVLDPHLNPQIRIEVVFSAMVVSLAVKLSVPRIVRGQLYPILRIILSHTPYLIYNILRIIISHTPYHPIPYSVSSYTILRIIISHTPYHHISYSVLVIRGRIMLDLAGLYLNKLGLNVHWSRRGAGIRAVAAEAGATDQALPSLEQDHFLNTEKIPAVSIPGAIFLVSSFHISRI